MIRLQPLTLSTLTIGQLNQLIRGRLSFGLMPPLNGESEPIGHVNASTHGAKPRDVVWTPPCDDWRKQVPSDQAYDHGALGVVAEFNTCPWNGRFAIKVDDATQSLWRYVDWLRATADQTIIAVIADGQTAPICDEFRRHQIETSPNLPAPWQCLDLQKRHNMSVIYLHERDFENRYCEIISPHVIVLTHKSQSCFVESHFVEDDETRTDFSAPAVVCESSVTNQVAAALAAAKVARALNSLAA